MESNLKLAWQKIKSSKYYVVIKIKWVYRKSLETCMMHSICSIYAGWLVLLWCGRGEVKQFLFGGLNRNSSEYNLWQRQSGQRAWLEKSREGLKNQVCTGESPGQLSSTLDTPLKVLEDFSKILTFRILPRTIKPERLAVEPRYESFNKRLRW